jgi:hypothetical protein
VRSFDGRPRTLSCAQNSPRQLTVASASKQDQADREQLNEIYGRSTVVDAYLQQQREIKFGSPIRTLRQILAGASAGQAVELPGNAAPELKISESPAAARSPSISAAELDALVQAGRAARDAGEPLPPLPKARQLTLLPPPQTEAGPEHPKACRCSCCLARRDQIKTWKSQQPPRRRHKPIYSAPIWWCLADREAKVRVKALTRALIVRGRRLRETGAIQKTDHDVLCMIISFQNDHTGECFPSMKTLAERTGYHVSTINASIGRLEHHGLIVVIPRRIKVREGKEAVWQTRVTSNAYHIIDPIKRYRRGIPYRKPSDSEIPNGVRVTNSKQGSFNTLSPHSPGIAQQGGSGVTLDG